jgi:hypothetical protein
MLAGEDEILIDLIRDEPEVVLPGQLDEGAHGLFGKDRPGRV